MKYKANFGKVPARIEPKGEKKMQTNVCEEMALEEMVDKCGIENVIGYLANVCHYKTEHILSNWQDGPLSKQWQGIASKLEAILPLTKGL